MDKIIERPTGWKAAFTRKALPWWLGAALACLVIFLLVKPSHSTLRVNSDSISVSEVKAGEFNDYIRLSGTVQPLVTIQISPVEGGIVDAILIEEGSMVKKGDEILRLSNDNLDLQILNSEAELAEKENILRNTQIQMEQDRLNVKQSKAEYQLDVKRLKRKYEQQKTLYEENLIAREDYLKAKEDYDLAAEKLQIILDKEVQDSLFRSTQVERMRESLENMQINMRMIRKRTDELLDYMGLTAVRNEKAGSLPYGLQRKLEIARAMALDPKLLLLDEPVSGVDQNGLELFYEILAELLAFFGALYHADFFRHVDGQLMIYDFSADFSITLELNPVNFDRLEIHALFKTITTHPWKPMTILCMNTQSFVKLPC